MSFSDEILQDQEALRSELQAARSKLEGLVRDLEAIDDELEELSMERQQFALVQDACAALEKLGQLGGSQLFWGDLGGEHQIRVAQKRVDDFERRISAIEGHRRELLQCIGEAQENTEYIEDDLFEAQREEELRKLEWIVERDCSPLPDREPVMPWSRGGDDDQRFRKSLATSLAVALLLAILVPLIELPEPEPWEVVEVPERLTRLIEEEVPPPPVAPPELIPEETLANAPDEPVRKAEVSKPTPETAKPTGILAFRDQFASLADHKPSARLGARARIDRAGEAQVGQHGRSLVATQTPGPSAGIDLASLSRDGIGGGGQALEGVEVGKATSTIGGIPGEDRPLSGGPGPGRTDEEIQIVFDRHKAALYRLYNRELRRDPTLQGQMALRITIEPDGSVSLCEVQSSDMDAPKLAAQVAERVSNFDFGAKEGVPAITFLYPIDFLPAT